jgi:hypothetical protein
VGASGTQLASDWKELESHLAIPACQFGVIAGGAGTPDGRNPLVAGDDDLIVGIEETRLAGAHDFLVLPLMHTFMMDDPAVQEATLRFLQHGFFVSQTRRQPISRDIR